MPGVLELSMGDTARSLAGRKIYRIQCCGQIMQQKSVQSLLPTEEIQFGRSLVLLRCRRCKREIELELITHYTSVEDIQKALGA